MPKHISLKGELLKNLQQTELSILKDVTAFCEENEIRYCVSSGTLLGAVRHEGFIPWDDDVDISMPRSDFEKFLSLANRLPKQYECQATRFDARYPISIVKVRKRGTLMKEPSMEHLNIQHGVWIDIFPLDRVEDVSKLAKRARRIHLITTVIGYKLGTSHPIKRSTKLFCNIVGLVGVKRLDRWRTAIMMKEEESGGKMLTNFASNLGYKNLLFDEKVYFPLKKIKFEDAFFYAPADSDKWLKGAYGDYMTLPPVEQRINRHKISEIKL